MSRAFAALCLSLLLSTSTLAAPDPKAAAARFDAQDWKGARPLYEELAAEYPEEPMYIMRTGYSAHMMGDSAAAMAAYEKVLKIGKPGQKSIAGYNLACLQSLAGDVDNAITSLRASVEAGFRDVKLLDEDTDLAAVRKSPAFADIRKKAGDNAANAPGLPPEYRHLDYWVGDWDAYTPAGQIQGRNTITKDFRGFLITENWSNTTGGGGTSMNFYDPVSKKWKQHWVDDAGQVITYEGGLIDGVMTLKGTAAMVTGEVYQSRMTLKKQPDGSIHHFIERSTDGKEWTTYFDGYYASHGKPWKPAVNP